jgi:hypothetical protein
MLDPAFSHDHKHREMQQSGSLEDLVEDIDFSDPSGRIRKGVRCATGSESNKTSVRRGLRDRTRATFSQVPAEPVTIPVKFHVITNASGYGNVTDQAILDQIAVLNRAYADSKFAFMLNPAVDVLRYVDNELATGCFLRRNLMKARYGVDIARFMNVNTCDPDFGNFGRIFGHSTMPDDYSEVNQLHGVLIYYATLPGGTAVPYNLGHTLTHEVGHYLGLHHTFQGGCEAKGLGKDDYVSDTPAEGSPAKGCPIGRDTCPQRSGLDPVTNYMDYSHDSCMNHFTPGQALRMHSETSKYRPTLYHG